MSGFSSAKSSKAKSTPSGDSTLESSYQRWITKQLELRTMEYSDVHKISICCGTWNVNARELGDDSDLREWLLSKSAPPADLYVIGLQEIVDLNITNVMLNSGASDERSLYWQDQVTTVLSGSGVEFVLLAERHMVGLQFMIFSRRSLKAAISDVRMSHIYTGGYGVTGNKGGIAVRFDMFDSPLCFICAHFHANRDNVEQRNLDFHTIMDLISFAPSSEPSSIKRTSTVAGAAAAMGSSSSSNGATPAPSAKQSRRPSSITQITASHKNIPLAINHHEHVFWLGDLNYRIDESLEEENVFELVQGGHWTGLRSKDQLTVEREKGLVFQHFEEGVISFPPTYKYQPGTNLYEQRPGKKLRAPAWCDRILWKSSNKSNVQLLSYKPAPIDVSDHKPVSAWFECGVRKVIPDRVREVYQELLFAVDKWINASSPKLTLEKRMYDFGEVSVNQRHTQSIVLTNAGTVMAEWKFVPKNDEKVISKPWLRFFPEEGILAPGESIAIAAHLYVSPDMLVDLSDSSLSRMPLEDIVILHVAKGSDFFCIFNGVLTEEGVETARRSLIGHRTRSPPSSSLKAEAQVSLETDSDDADA